MLGGGWEEAQHEEPPLLAHAGLPPRDSTAQHSTAQHSTAQHSTAQHSMRFWCATDRKVQGGCVLRSFIAVMKEGVPPTIGEGCREGDLHPGIPSYKLCQHAAMLRQQPAATQQALAGASVMIKRCIQFVYIFIVFVHTNQAASIVSLLGRLYHRVTTGTCMLSDMCAAYEACCKVGMRSRILHLFRVYYS